MSSGMNLVIYPVTDIAAATATYTKLLGTRPYAEQPYYVGFRIGDFELGLDPNGHSLGLTGPVGYVNVDDIKEAVDTLGADGAQIVQDVPRCRRRPAGRRGQGRRRQRHRPPAAAVEATAKLSG